MSDQPIINITSHNQTGGVTAHTVNNYHMQHAPRKFDARVGLELMKHLEGVKTVKILSALGDPDAFQFSEDVHNFLVSKGITISEIMDVMQSPPLRGQLVDRNGEEAVVTIGHRV